MAEIVVISVGSQLTRYVSRQMFVEQSDLLKQCRFQRSHQTRNINNLQHVTIQTEQQYTQISQFTRFTTIVLYTELKTLNTGQMTGVWLYVHQLIQ